MKICEHCVSGRMVKTIDVNHPYLKKITICKDCLYRRLC
jgi:hypothetical protein